MKRRRRPGSVLAIATNPTPDAGSNPAKAEKPRVEPDSEYSTGMIRSTVLSAPRRTPVLAAKAVVFAGLVFVLAGLVALPCFLLGSSITSAHADVSLTSWTSLRAIVCFGLYMGLIGLIALAVGTLVRRPAGGISLILAFQFALPGVLGLIPGSVGDHISQALPANASVMMGSGHNASDVYSPTTGFLILLTWAVALLAAARWSLKKRNV